MISNLKKNLTGLALCLLLGVIIKAETSQNNCFYKSFEEQFAQDLQRAEQGNSWDQYSVGCHYEYGEGVEKNLKKAFEWYLKSANQENVEGMLSVAECYEEGIGVEKDIEKAAEWRKKEFDLNKITVFDPTLKKAESGDANAQWWVGIFYSEGQGVEKNDEKAFEWFLKSAEQGYDSAIVDVARCYAFGQGINKNITKAKEWYSKRNTDSVFLGGTYVNFVDVDLEEALNS